MGGQNGRRSIGIVRSLLSYLAKNGKGGLRGGEKFRERGREGTAERRKKKNQLLRRKDRTFRPVSRTGNKRDVQLKEGTILEHRSIPQPQKKADEPQKSNSRKD